MRPPSYPNGAPAPHLRRPILVGPAMVHAPQHSPEGMPSCFSRVRPARTGWQGETQDRGHRLHAHVVGNERRSRQGQRGAAAGGDRELRDQCDLPHAGASERRVGFTLSSPPCPGRQPQAPPGHLSGQTSAAAQRLPRLSRAAAVEVQHPRRSFSARGPNASPAPSKAAAALVRLEAAADDEVQSGALARARVSQAGIRLVHQRRSAGTGRGHPGKLALPAP